MTRSTKIIYLRKEFNILIPLTFDMYKDIKTTKTTAAFLENLILMLALYVYLFNMFPQILLIFLFWSIISLIILMRIS